MVYKHISENKVGNLNTFVLKPSTFCQKCCFLWTLGTVGGPWNVLCIWLPKTQI
ncbi:mCG64162 [Mus musculus]|nr:mCG64162 [Mus musculus]